MRTIGLSGKLKFCAALTGVLLLQLLFFANSPQVSAKNEKFEWKNASTIYASGGVLGEYRYELKKSTAAFYDNSGNIITEEAYVYKEDVAGILDVTRDCYLQFGVLVGSKKANGSIRQLVPDPINMAASNVCDDLGNLETILTISNAEKSDDKPENLTVVITIRSPSDEPYKSDTVTLRGKDNKQLGKIEVKEDDVKNSENYKTAEVQFKNIDAKNESFLEACSRALNLCSKSGNLAELLAGPVFDDKVFIEIEPRDAEEDADTSCAIDGIGWIVCPVMTFMGKLNDAAFGFLNNFLQVEPKLLTDRDTQAAWSNFRDIANIAFVIVFLIIIYSQITSAGISNYGIKRMLPKLFVAAILVNISYFICQIAVDISNILGSSLYSMFKDMPTTNGDTVGFGDGLSWEVVAGYILAGTATLLVGVLALTTISTAALLAFALVILILIARKAILVLLVVVAPLAFVAYLLPNTEQWFKRWWKMFVTLLMVFPVVAVIFGASTLAARIISNSAGGENAEGGDQYLLQITALGIMAIPLFAVPAVLKGALSATGSIGAKVAGWQDRANRGAMNKAKSGRLGEARAAFTARRNKRRVARRLGEGTIASWGSNEKRAGTRRGKFAAWAGSRGAAFDRSSVGQYLGGDRGAAGAVAEQQKMNNEEVERSISLLHGSGDAAGLIGRAQKQLVEANKRGDAIAARAATKILATQTGSRGIDALHQTVSEIEQGGGLHGNIGEDVKYEVTAAGLKGKNRSLDKWSRDEKTVINPATGSPKAASLSDYDSDAGTPGSLNEHEIAGHSVKQLERYGTSGAVDKALAKRVLDAHGMGTLSLDGEKLQVFRDISAGKTFTPPPAGSPPGTKGTWV